MKTETLISDILDEVLGQESWRAITQGNRDYIELAGLKQKILAMIPDGEESTWEWFGMEQKPFENPNEFGSISVELIVGGAYDEHGFEWRGYGAPDNEAIAWRYRK